MMPLSSTVTPFTLLCDRCGLSPEETAVYLEVPADLVALWSREQSCPDDMIGQLRLLYRQISQFAEAAMREFGELSRQQGAIAAAELSLAPDDAAARQLGLPCIGAHRAALAMVIARAHGTRFKLIS